jgi:alpha-tubulin suppressor-like RCC1 family protein
MVGDNGTYFFRYKDLGIEEASLPEPENKDVTAFFVGGVGFEFSELLPLKPEWQDDRWSVLPGSALPPGISFNSGTRTFEGMPTTAGIDTVVQLEGVDSLGNTVAKAEAHFDLYAIQGVPVHGDLYAHTGKYKLDEMKVPSGVVIDSWQHIYPLPAGVAASGPYIQGTPSAAARKRYMLFGKNYMGEVVATFWGNYIVEDGPTFNHPVDWAYIRELPINDGAQFDIKVPESIYALHAINPDRPVRYYLEVDPVEGLPANVAPQNMTSSGFTLFGSVYDPFDTGKIRVKAIDSDATVGYSGWLTFGTGQPQLSCGSQAPVFSLKTGVKVSMSPPRPVNSSGSVAFSLVSGTLPDGLQLTDNLIVGTPTEANQDSTVDIAATVTQNGQTGDPQSCPMKFRTLPGDLSLADATNQQDRHVRVGKTYAGIAQVKGGQNPYEVKAANGSLPDGFVFTTQTKDTAQVGVSGDVTAAGSHTVPLTLSNGDGNDISGQLSYIGHGPLNTGAVPTISVQRLGPSKVWGSIPYDVGSVIPDVTGARDYPEFTISNPSGLPGGIAIQGADFVGATAAVAKSYGTFTVTMSDYEGKPVTSNAFELIVTPREEIDVGNVVDPVFTVRWAEQKATPLVVKQPDGAKNFRVDYTINNVSSDPLPSWLSFNATTGEITARAQIPYADKHKWGPYTITAVDEEGSSGTTRQFYVDVADWPSPDAFVSTTFKGTVTGNTAAGENPTWINIPGVAATSLRAYVVSNTVIGGSGTVTFTGSTPSKPAGLDFNMTEGTFSGVPTSEFNGNVEVSFADEVGREGRMLVPLEIRAYPTVAMEQTTFEVPRLANAALMGVPIKAEAVSGFWNSPVWTVDTSKGPDLPAGLTLNRGTGLVEGSATAAEGSVVSGIVIKATSVGGNGERLESWTAPFTVKIVKPAPISLSYSASKMTYFLVRDVNGKLSMSSRNPTASPTPIVGGSSEKPLEYSIDTSDAVANGMTGTIGINKDTGRITGSPDKLGEWQVTVTVRDGGGRSPAPFTLTIKSTLDGWINRTNGENTLTLRQDERFKTDPIAISNYVGNVIFSTLPAILDDGLALDTDSGALLDTSHFSQPVSGYRFTIAARDNDNRGFETNPFQTFNVIAPMTATAVTPDISAKQYGTAGNGGIDASWSVSTRNVIKAVRYSISGDLPGTLVYKAYDEQGAFTGWSWKDEDGNGKWVAANTQDGSGLLPYDALVFDTLHPSLVGSPSKSGVFPGVRIIASDTHSSDYAAASPNRVEYNQASVGPFAISVDAAAPFTVSASAPTETIHRYTDVPTLRVDVSNAAVGKPVTWTLVSGTLPGGITPVKADTSASFTGFATEKGTYPNIVWRARDAAGRTATAPAMALVVEERKGLELSAKPAPFGVVEGTPLPSFAVNALNSAYGKAIPASDWVLPTSGLPSGLSMSIANGRAVLSGTTSAVGDYSVQVSATDSLGSSDAASVAISVLDEDEKLEVSSTSGRTKKGFPAELQITPVSRAFGDIGYVSSDTAVSVDSTGKVSATYATTGHMTPVVTVSDSTRRTTDRVLSIDVIDDLEIVVPTVYAEAGAERITQVTTANVLGTVTYSKGAGTWPAGLTVDAATGEIKGVVTEAKGNTFTGLTVRGDDTFIVAGTTYHDVVESNAFDVVVDGTPTGFALETPATTGMVSAVFVNRDIEDFAISPVNQAWNMAIPQGKWAVNTSGAALPPGVTFGYANGKIVATGTPTALGTYGPYTFTATDGLGQTASATLSIRVITPDDAIVVNVADVTTKVGLPINMQSSATNTYGKVAFYSYAIDGDPQTHVPGEYKSNLAINSTTGLVTGSFPTIGDRTFDVYASDATKRVTSKPVKVSVLPNLRIVVPDIVQADPYVNVDRTVDTAYALGTVSYTKGAGTWPDGFTVDAATGAIKATAPLTAGLGTYPDLTIRATDTFTGGTETRESNVFAIKIEATGPYIRMLPNTQVLMTNAQKRVAYTFDATTLAQFQNAGATDFSFKWEAATGSTLPTGLSMSTAGLITGTPKNSGSYQVKITGTNKTNSKITSSAVYTFVIDLPTLTMNIVGNPTDATRTLAYSFNLVNLLDLQNVPTAGLVYTWSTPNAGQQLPPGMTLANGVISGTSRDAGSFEFHLKVEFTESNAVAEYKAAEADVILKVTTPPTSGFTDISSGMNHVCGIRKGEVWCWGAGTGGQLGNGANANSNVPVRAGSISNAVVVAAGVDASYAVTADGALWTWGANSYGQLGTGNTTARNAPGKILSSGVTYVTANRVNIAPGGGSACAVKDGEGYCWGTGSYGQLGIGSTASPSTPTKILNVGAGVTSIDMEYIQSYATKSNGTFWAWGWNGENRLCGGTQNAVNPTPRLVTQATGQYAAKYATGYIQYQTVSDTLVTCQSGMTTLLTNVKFASSTYSALLDGTVAANSGGAKVTDATSVVKVSSGATANCAIDSYGEAMCWGTGTSGQLGNGSNGSSTPAVAVKRMW